MSITAAPGKKMVISVKYTVYDQFVIPKGVSLMTAEEIEAYHEKRERNMILPIGYWYVKWNTLHYINSKGDEIEVESEWSAPIDYDWKRPDMDSEKIEFEDGEAKPEPRAEDDEEEEE
jgi:hypothetical protein